MNKAYGINRWCAVLVSGVVILPMAGQAQTTVQGDPARPSQQPGGAGQQTGAQQHLMWWPAPTWPVMMIEPTGPRSVVSHEELRRRETTGNFAIFNLTSVPDQASFLPRRLTVPAVPTMEWWV